MHVEKKDQNDITCDRARQLTFSTSRKQQHHSTFVCFVGIRQNVFHQKFDQKKWQLIFQDLGQLELPNFNN